MITYRVQHASNLAAFKQAVRSQLAPTVTKQWAARWMGFIRRRFDRASKGDGTWAPLANSTVERRRYARGRGLNIGQARRATAATTAKIAVARRKAQAKMLAATTPEARAKARLAFRDASRRVRQSIQKQRRVETAAGSAAILRDTGTMFGATRVGAPGNLFEATATGFRAGFAPTKHGSDRVTVAQLVDWHNRGAGNYPARTIIVPPDTDTARGMMSDLQRGVQKLARENQLRGVRRP